jgi:hypothetical protein
LLQANRERDTAHMTQLENDIQRLSVSGGVASEPTTPPDVRDSLQDTVLPPIGSRHGHNRFSLASISSFQSASNPRPSRSFHRSTASGSHHTINYLGLGRDVTAQSSNLTSRGNSDEEEEVDAFDMAPATSRRANM